MLQSLPRATKSLLELIEEHDSLNLFFHLIRKSLVFETLMKRESLFTILAPWDNSKEFNEFLQNYNDSDYLNHFVNRHILLREFILTLARNT